MLRRLKENQRGQILVFTVLLIPIIFLFFAAAINAGVLYIEYTRLQNAADAAALAGATRYAKYYTESPFGNTGLTEWALKMNAEDAAQDAIEKSVEANLPGGTIITKDTDYAQKDYNETSSQERFLWWTYTVTTANTTNTVTSTVRLSEKVKLIGDSFNLFDNKIFAESQASQDFTVVQRISPTRGLATKSTDKYSKLTQ